MMNKVLQSNLIEHLGIQWSDGIHAHTKYSVPDVAVSVDRTMPVCALTILIERLSEGTRHFPMLAHPDAVMCGMPCDDNHQRIRGK